MGKVEHGLYILRLPTIGSSSTAFHSTEADISIDKNPYNFSYFLSLIITLYLFLLQIVFLIQ